MADIELVIKIPEELYDIIINPQKLETMYHAGKICEAVRNGTPLPKGHGRLIDADALQEDCLWWETDLEVSKAPTIIEADKGDSED